MNDRVADNNLQIDFCPSAQVTHCPIGHLMYEVE